MRGVEQSLPDEAEGTRFWWEGVGSNRLMVRASARGGWAFSGSFLPDLLIPQRKVVSEGRLNYFRAFEAAGYFRSFELLAMGIFEEHSQSLKCSAVHYSGLPFVFSLFGASLVTEGWNVASGSLVLL